MPNKRFVVEYILSINVNKAEPIEPRLFVIIHDDFEEVKIRIAKKAKKKLMITFFKYIISNC